MQHLLLMILSIMCCSPCVSSVSAEPTEDSRTYRLYPGIAAYVHNPKGEALDLSIELRDWNVFASGPREVMLKVYDPEGRPVIRQLIEDDGIVSRGYQPAIGGWDHEMWYYAMCYGRGTLPMLRWSSFSEPGRLAGLTGRTFQHSISSRGPGVYRILITGARDHTVTMRLTPSLKYALAGHPLWLHGHGHQLRRSYVYVPKGTTGLHFGFAEYDQPVTRRLTIRAPGGAALFDGPADGGFQDSRVRLETPGEYDDKLLTAEVSPGQGDFMVHLNLVRPDLPVYRGRGSVPALFAPDAATAKAIRGGAIYHGDQVFWHGFQVRFHDWLQTLEPEDFAIRDKQGKEIEPVPGGKVYGWAGRAMTYPGLPTREGFLPLNGKHEAPPKCDILMHHYPAHRQRGALNLALKDLERGLRQITVGDIPGPTNWNGNLGYLFGTYGFHYWRPAWRILQQSDAPQEMKDIVHEAMILCGDRLAFGRTIERVNGNAFAHIPGALRYCAEATQDPLQKRLAEEYFDRFASEGWGRGTGISPSGGCQEHFAHAFHYGTYILDTFAAVIADLKDPGFKRVWDGVVELYGYIYCPGATGAPWSSRTAYGAGSIQRRGVEPKCVPGPDLTLSIKNANEWFVARRKNYYVVTYHGRLAPMWLNYYFASRLGYGGGLLCQVTVPGKEAAIASTLNKRYGRGMQPWNWRNMHLHSIVGEMADGRPLVTADSIHADARLTGNVVESSGEVRDRPVRVRRRYTFEPDHIACEVSLADTKFRAAYWGQGHPQTIREAHEMIPFVGGKTTKVTATGPKLEHPVPLAPEAVAAQSITIDRGGYGVKIELPTPMPVLRGANSTVLIQLVSEPTKAEQLALSYRIVPFGSPAMQVKSEKETK